MEKFERPQEESFNPEKKEKEISRRDFLKKLGIGIGAVAASAGLAKLGLYKHESEEKYKSEHMRSEEVVISRKEIITKDPMLVPQSDGQNIHIYMMPQPETYRIHFTVDNQDNYFDVTKDVYDSYNEGSEVTVKYIPREGSRVTEIISIENKK